MTRQLRRVAAVMFVLFAALFVNLNYLQVLRADDLAGDNRNSRRIIAEYAVQRGSIVAGDGGDAVEIARSGATDGRYKYERSYPQGPLWAHLTGFYSLVYGRAELEAAANRLLVGDAPEAFARNLGDFLTGREPQGDDVVVTLRPAVQAAAREALGERTGAVVALEPATGAVLALWANPTYDPNELATFDRDAAVAYWERTENERRNRALRELYPPGSTFKIVTAAAALEDGVTPDDTFDDPREYTPPQTTAAIGNFGGDLCNGGNPLTLQRALEVSCNTTFARLGVDVGAAKLVAQAEAFGLNAAWDFQLPFAPSGIPVELDPPSTAQSAIGQRDVRVTPLQMAMVAATVANDGVLMRPYVIDRVEDFSGRVVREATPQPLALGGDDDGRVVSPTTAAALQAMMRGVVTDGSGGNAAIDGVDVAGKTGTAEVGDERNPTVWFVGFAPLDDPRVAVAVVVPDGGDVGSEATGGAVAAPIAKAVLEAALR
ncbi:MAG: penicillin-binding protein 2 [Actinomycetota bacterium]|nr:penicillin-binding protein 2 [Actinomycetota bacterium]